MYMSCSRLYIYCIWTNVSSVFKIFINKNPTNCVLWEMWNACVYTSISADENKCCLKCTQRKHKTSTNAIYHTFQTFASDVTIVWNRDYKISVSFGFEHLLTRKLCSASRYRSKANNVFSGITWSKEQTVKSTCNFDIGFQKTNRKNWHKSVISICCTFNNNVHVLYFHINPFNTK